MSKSAQQVLTHPQRVKFLYKTILKLHRGLPLELKALGDQYTKDEFRRHQNADESQTKTFMVEWTDYAIKLTEQLGIKGPRLSKPIGESFTESDLDKFSDEQIVQLHELYNETVGTKSTHNDNS